MTPRLAVAACAVLVASASAGAARPPVALVASPSRVSLAGTARATVEVVNSGSEAVVVDVGRAGFALDLRGRPQILARHARWVAVRPAQLAIAAGGTAFFAISSRPPGRAEPGDHSELVLLTTRPLRGKVLAVRMRLGVVVVVRVPGKVVRRLRPLALRARRVGRRVVLDLRVANQGNITETIGRECLTVSLRRSGRVLARLHPTRRQILPRSSGLVELPYRGGRSGPVTARVVFSGISPCAGEHRRDFHVRL